VTVPIALVGTEAAHALANAAFGSPDGPGEVFAGAASGAELAPALAAIALATVVVALAARAAGRWWLPRAALSVALPFVWLPPLAFVLLELLEGILNHGTVPWSHALEPTFLVGLALQLPFAFAGYLAARLLLRVSDDLRELVGRRAPSPPLVPAPLLVAPRPDDRPRARHDSSGHFGRAPPAGLVASG
jgi:hypothetical protein